MSHRKFYVEREKRERNITKQNINFWGINLLLFLQHFLNMK